ncbi:hypothetical protein HMPREF3291_08180 [Bacillus sp. HMSC76G11]|nr:hypothetical protein HMPREF3291_08180 [Bacillus sp. HMSC76G11]
MGVTISLINTPINAIVQTKTDPAMLGRVMSFIIMAALGLTPLSYGLTSLFISAGADVQTIFPFLCFLQAPLYISKFCAAE